MSIVDDFTITVPLSSPDLRSALEDVAQALSDAEAAVQASATGPSVGNVNKPGSKPPAGNTAAANLCRKLANDAGGMKRKVASFYALMDPEERAAAKRQRKELREIRDKARADAQQSIVSAGRMARDA